MVKSEQYTCKICDKQYSSASSIWNHRTKIHNNNIDPSKHSVNINEDKSKHIVNIISPLEIETIKEYKCRNCNKFYKYKQSRWFHEKSCNETINKNKEIVEKKNNTSIQTQNNITKNGNNNTNNGTINNETINNITINNYGTVKCKS